jgi:hypothetical protein
MNDDNDIDDDTDTDDNIDSIDGDDYVTRCYELQIEFHNVNNEIENY